MPAALLAVPALTHESSVTAAAWTELIDVANAEADEKPNIHAARQHLDDELRNPFAFLAPTIRISGLDAGGLARLTDRAFLLVGSHDVSYHADDGHVLDLDAMIDRIAAAIAQGYED